MERYGPSRTRGVQFSDHELLASLTDFASIIMRKQYQLRIQGETSTGIASRLSPMPLIIILILLLLLVGGGGYYMGPGLGYYGGGGLSLVLALVIIYLFFGRGRDRL